MLLHFKNCKTRFCNSVYTLFNSIAIVWARRANRPSIVLLGKITVFKLISTHILIESTLIYLSYKCSQSRTVMQFHFKAA